jgi:hypothetical protein
VVWGWLFRIGFCLLMDVRGGLKLAPIFSKKRRNVSQAAK